MISINAEKGLVRIDSWADILERVDYRARIDPVASPMKQVIGGYEFDEEVHCGLLCNQPHKKGFLVTTQDGFVTNIGKDCGKTYSGLESEHARIAYERERERFERREAVSRVKNRLPSLREELEEIKAQGGTWAHTEMRRLMDHNGPVPKIVRDQLSTMIKVGSTRLTLRRVVSTEEQKVREAQAGRTLPQQHEDVTLGNISGMGAFSPDKDLRRLIAEDLSAMFQRAAEINEDRVGDRDLGVMAKWAGEVDRKIETVRETVVLCRQLLTQRNLRILSGLPMSKSDMQSFNSWLASLPVGDMG
jgi:hypothetical protein